MNVLCLDPSGNMGEREGEGTTGWALFKDGELSNFGTIKSSDFGSQEEYWSNHVWNIFSKIKTGDRLVMESYRLFAHKAKQQSGSSMDTPQLIGFLRMMCWGAKIDIDFQEPSDKVRVADPQLVKMGILEHRNGRYYCQGKPTVIHSRDAIRHGIFWHRYGKGSGLVEK
jgi:hypothetical protein